MASEIFDVALKGDSQRMLRRGRIPAGSTFADLERYILRSMGWDRDAACGFRFPGSDSPMEDRNSPWTPTDACPSTTSMDAPRSG